MANRSRLQAAAIQIAANHNKPESRPFKALSKLVIAPRWTGPGVRANGLRRWKRGELFEFIEAALRRDSTASEEWGDVGYYVAQTWGWLWWLYESVTPTAVIESAVSKFERRARDGQRLDNSSTIVRRTVVPGVSSDAQTE